MEQKREKKPRKPRKKQLPEDTWQNLEYWIKRNPDKSVEECEKIRKEKLRSHKSKKPSMLEYWIINNPDKSIDECKELHRQYGKENNFQCIEYWIKRNPDKSIEDCKRLLEERQKEYLAKRPDNSGEKNPGHRSKTTIEERKRRSPMCREFWELKYPNASPEEIDDILKKERIKIAKTHTPEKTSTRIEYWLAKGYSEEEAKQKLKERQSTFTFEKCIEKYGKDLGEIIFNDRQERWKKSLHKNFEKHGDGRSAQSELAYDIVCRLCNKLGILRPIKEKWMYDTVMERSYAFDFTYNNKIIEINGDYWHANPIKYKANDFIKAKRKSAEEIWIYDKQKIECAERNGYKVHVLWEHDWMLDPDKELEKCIEFLNE